MRSRRALLLAVLVSTLVGACSAGVDDGRFAGPSADASREDVPSALDDPGNPELPTPLIDVGELRQGGPPPDGIPPIDDPRFETATEVDWLSDDEPVLVLTLGDETKAYPVRVLTWHEIVNDVVGGVPVAVTYCPLCNSGVAFERSVNGHGVLSFGTSGMLYADNLVMYDRQTESLWPQLTGEASVGVLTGVELTAIPIGPVGWRDFAAAHPDSAVLSQDTGFSRPYGTNPYTGYDDPGGDLLFELPVEADARLPVKERVVGLGEGADSVAVVRSLLVGRPPREVTVDGRDVVMWHRPGQASALDADSIPDGAEIGTVVAFDPEVDGRRLHLEARDAEVVDRETGSTWTVLGRASSGPMRGAELTPVRFLDTFWFAWVTFHPDTTLITR
jgi:hypothetical protein